MNGISNDKILNYDQLAKFSQVNDGKSDGIVSLANGQLTNVSKADYEKSDNKLNTSDVRQAVFEAIKGKYASNSVVVNAAKRELLGNGKLVDTNKAQQPLNEQDLKKLLKDCEDLNKNSCVLKGKPIDYLLPQSGEKLKLTRDQLEANLDKWLKAGFSVTVTVKGKGSYKICEEKGKEEHSRQALFTPENGVQQKDRTEFKFPEGNYGVTRSIPDAKSFLSKSSPAVKTSTAQPEKRVVTLTPNFVTNKMKVSTKYLEGAKKGQIEEKEEGKLPKGMIEAHKAEKKNSKVDVKNEVRIKEKKEDPVEEKNKDQNEEGLKSQIEENNGQVQLEKLQIEDDDVFEIELVPNQNQDIELEKRDEWQS